MLQVVTANLHCINGGLGYCPRKDQSDAVMLDLTPYLPKLLVA